MAANLATPAIVDLRKVEDRLDKPSGRWMDEGIVPLSPDGYVLNPQQIKNRMRRAAKRYARSTGISIQEASAMYKKPLDEWDAEELARGRPRNKNGTFSGKSPTWISGEVHEEAMDRFKSIVKTGMRIATVDAIEVVKTILNDSETDNRGKPLVPASTKLQAAQFLIEHVVGKPTQRIESDVSVKLQGILAGVMINPGEDMGNYTPAHLPGITMELAALGRGPDDSEVYDDIEDAEVLND